MRKMLGVCLLALLLTTSAAAGEMPNGLSVPTPTPTPTSTAQEPTDIAGEPTTSDETSDDLTDSLTQAVLNLLTALPSLL